jgi:S-adenosylmethionine:tRNA ribosyltransferase-isomerase
MKTADFDYVLPEFLIAEKPLKERSVSRLLVLHRNGRTEHRYFFDLPSYLEQGDTLIINNTKVFPARLTGTKKNGKTLDILLVKEEFPGTWEVLSKGNFSGRLRISEELEVDLQRGTSARFQYSGDLMDLIWKYGDMPLPPYIGRSPDQSDKQAYQTVYATKEGSIAAPTAGLHFTRPLLEAIASKGVKIRELTLHVGVGTFRPVRTKMAEDHCMEREYFEISKAMIAEIREAKAARKRVIAVGTTTTRSLEGYFSGRFNNGSKIRSSPDSHPESAAHDTRGEEMMPSRFIAGTTDIFISPGYAFQVIDSLVTNFHLPRSTPLMLVSALAGREMILTAYNEAISNGYRFLSYGDAMLIL